MITGSLPGRVTVAVVDDHPIVVLGLTELLRNSRFRIIWQALNRRQCLELSRVTQPDIIILDLRIGDDLALDVHRELRASGSTTSHWLILTGHDDEDLLRACLNAGASGILLKDSRELHIVRGLERAMNGEIVLDHRLQRLSAANVATQKSANSDEMNLSTREHEVLRLVARGMTSRQISIDLDLSLNTIRSYVQSVLMKLGAHTRVEAIAIARRQRLI